VYLVKWLNESIGKCLIGSLGTLGCLVAAVEAVLDNTGVFLEPYVSETLDIDGVGTDDKDPPIPCTTTFYHSYRPTGTVASFIVGP
jgi:hypothetical protein